MKFKELNRSIEYCDETNQLKYQTKKSRANVTKHVRKETLMLQKYEVSSYI